MVICNKGYFLIPPSVEFLQSKLASFTVTSWLYVCVCVGGWVCVCVVHTWEC